MESVGEIVVIAPHAGNGQGASRGGLIEKVRFGRVKLDGVVRPIGIVRAAELSILPIKSANRFPFTPPHDFRSFRN